MISVKVSDFLAREWEVAIILDACRYDSFKSLHLDYLGKGRLEKCIGGSCTPHWLRSVFPHEYPNIVYVSGNPWINSSTPWNGFDPRGKFKEIYDVWDWAWDEKLKTVPPSEVSKAALKARKRHPEKRLVVHYLQPHYPYLGIRLPEEVKMDFEGVDGRGDSKGPFLKLYKLLGRELEKLLGSPRVWSFRDRLKAKPNHIEEYLWRTYTPEQLRSLYEDNLRRVLHEVQKLLDHLRGKIVVTSDHGEAFGEYGEFFHPIGTTNPVVRQVPCWKNEFL